MGKIHDWLRKPKTAQELRQLAIDEKEGIKIRRRRKLIPTLYDDNWRDPPRTWKKHRKTQYKSNQRDKPLGPLY